MAILGTGIDIVENYRLKKILLKKKSNFKKKIFTIKEITYCEKKSNTTGCYSKRFAAKEAFVKALGIGFKKNIALISYTYKLFCPFEFRFMFSLSRVIFVTVKER